MKKVSVIVPAYNAHDTMARCLGSLVNQTLQNLEIIVIDDVSKDDTRDIVARCKEQFPDKIVSINNESNLGPGGARNKGLEVASGEYIGFVDSDDYVHSSMYQIMYETAITHDADIVDCGYFTEATNKSSISVIDSMNGNLSDETRKNLILGGGYLCSKLFKRALFYEPPVKMRENVKILEDNDVLKYMYLRANRIWNVPHVLYMYCDTPGSATKIVELETYCQSIYGAMGSIYDMCHSLPGYERLKETFEYTIIKWYSYGINRCLYDQIVKCGADIRCIPRYFENTGYKENEILKQLSAQKKRVISIPYRRNPEVTERISNLDIQIMEEVDRRYGKL